MLYGINSIYICSDDAVMSTLRLCIIVDRLFGIETGAKIQFTTTVS